MISANIEANFPNRCEWLDTSKKYEIKFGQNSISPFYSITLLIITQKLLQLHGRNSVGSSNKKKDFLSVIPALAPKD